MSSTPTPEQQAARRHQTEAALAAVRNRGGAPPPTIDFTIHVQEDGTEISTRERVVKDVQAPAFLKPTDDQFYSDASRTKPDIAFLKNHFYREGRLTDEQVGHSFTHYQAQCSRPSDPDWDTKPNPTRQPPHHKHQTKTQIWERAPQSNQTH